KLVDLRKRKRALIQVPHHSKNVKCPPADFWREPRKLTYTLVLAPHYLRISSHEISHQPKFPIVCDRSKENVATDPTGAPGRRCERRSLFDSGFRQEE